ncbi:endonuclease/exonuclease/phosphatase family protein [Catalinimonas sp. 4WD22]|uniref:endonuclease/exonuclease/phosphatase family protein n=1 Tax=Catalinimonas locisalis TaxID=3133978 RepID=UPI003100C399
MKHIILGLIFISVFSLAYAQEDRNIPSDEIKLLFWNVENLFDTYDDSLKNDEEFLPYGIRGWNIERYQQKLFHLYKTFIAAGQWKFPEIIALAEIENEKVLKDLLEQTPLLRAGYEIVHQESEDRRGIDLAVLYRPEKVHLLDTNFIRLTFPGDGFRKTRDIIYLKAQVRENSAFHLFVNHWPSRYGGGKASEERRIYAASVVSEHVDQLLDQDQNSAIIVTGDFNDTPADKSLQVLAGKDSSLMIISDKTFAGTHKHQGLWNHFDHMWVSKALLMSSNFYAKEHIAEIFHPDWLLEKDKTYGGVKPNRTYEGYRYHGGFSDHLPLMLTLKIKPRILAEKDNY